MAARNFLPRCTALGAGGGENVQNQKVLPLCILADMVFCIFYIGCTAYMYMKQELKRGTKTSLEYVSASLEMKESGLELERLLPLPVQHSIKVVALPSLLRLQHLR